MKITTLINSLSEMLSKISELASERPEWVEESDDSIKLDGKTKAQFLTEVKDVVDGHTGRRDNPHGVTLAALDGVSRQYVDAKMDTTVLFRALSLSQYGSIDDTPLSVTYSGWNVQFTQPVGAYIQGIYGILPATSIDLRDVDSLVVNTSFHVYLQMTQQGMQYYISKDILAESLSVMWLGRITTGSMGISNIDINKVSRIGTTRVSETPRGSSIAVTAGRPDSPGTLAPMWR